MVVLNAPSQKSVAVVNQSKGSASRTLAELGQSAPSRAVQLPLQVALNALTVIEYPSPPSSEYVGRRKSNNQVVFPSLTACHSCEDQSRMAIKAPQKDVQLCDLVEYETTCVWQNSIGG